MRKLACYLYIRLTLILDLTALPRLSTPAPGASPGIMDQDIPPEIFDQIAAQQTADGANGASSTAIRICPHCTFENTHSGTDCEVCGLPLG